MHTFVQPGERPRINRLIQPMRPVQSIGFALPVGAVRRHVEAMKKGEVIRPGYLGILGSPPQPGQEEDGARIVRVMPGSPAAAGDLKAGDLIVTFAGKPVENFDRLRHLVEETTPGTTVTLGIQRLGGPLPLEVTIGRRPEPRAAGRAERLPEMPRWHQWPEMPMERGPWLGVHVQELTAAMRQRLDAPAERGVLVNQVAPDSPAEKAGLRPLDVILSLDGIETNSPEALTDAIGRQEPGQEVPLVYHREGVRHEARVTLQRPGREWGEGLDLEPLRRLLPPEALEGLEEGLKWVPDLGPSNRELRQRHERQLDELREQLRQMRQEMERLRDRLREQQAPESEAEKGTFFICAKHPPGPCGQMMNVPFSAGRWYQKRVAG